MAGHTGKTRQWKPRVSLRLKAILFVAGLQVVLFLVLAYVLVNNFHTLTEVMFERHFIQMAEVLGTGNQRALMQKDRVHLQHEIQELTRQQDINYVILHDASGTILSEDFDSSAAGRDLRQYSIKALRATKPMVLRVGPVPRGFFHERGHNLEIVAPIMRNNEKIAIVRMGVTTEAYNQKLAVYSKRVMALLLGSFLFVGLLLFYVDRQVRETLKHLIHTTGLMTRGDLSRRVMIQTGDELEELGKQFNTMADALEERTRELQRHQAELEVRVRERTRELEEERNKLRAIVDNVPSAFLLVDKDGLIQTASQNFHELGGFRDTNLIGRLCEPHLWENTLCDECLFHQVIESGRSIKREIRQNLPDESIRWIEQITVPVYNQSKVESVIEILTDITERKRLEYQLIQSEKLATTGEIAAVIAHEVRNSLTSLKMILQLLRESGDMSEEELESLGVSLDSVGRMEQLVNDLLQFAQPRPVQKNEKQLNEIVRGSVNLVGHELERSGIKVDIDLQDDLPVIPVDQKYLEEALVNLLLNGIQSLNGTQGRIYVKTSLTTLSESTIDTFIENRWSTEALDEPGETRETKRRPHIPPHPAGERPFSSEPDHQNIEQSTVNLVLPVGIQVIQVEIRDNGSGIPEEFVPRIFDPFFTTKLNGTGLGLSLVKRIINEHHGTIDFSTESGHGTTFRMLLPLNEQDVEVATLKE